MPRPSTGDPSVPGRLVDEIGVEWASSVEGEVVRWTAHSTLWTPPAAFQDPGGDADPAGVVAEVVGEKIRSILVRWNERTAKLWWVEVPETSADPPAMNIVAYDDPALAPGAVIDDAAFVSLPVQASQQVGAYRWWPSTGEVHQMYVSPDGRREGIGIGLGTFAWSYAWLRGWPAQFTGGYRTDEGEGFLEVTKPWWSGQMGPRTHISPPMTPREL
jgi:GNAT superfamily N-acetyltransferase